MLIRVFPFCQQALVHSNRLKSIPKIGKVHGRKEDRKRSFDNGNLSFPLGL